MEIEKELLKTGVLEIGNLIIYIVPLLMIDVYWDVKVIGMKMEKTTRISKLI
jgi:hypothetical protein